MNRRTFVAAALASTAAPRLIAGTPTLKPPVARRTDHSFTRHGITVQDPYAWLKDASYPKVDDPEVLAYLEAENAYYAEAMKPRTALVDTLFEELKGRVKQDDATVPYPDGDWLYWSAFETGGQYRNWYRRAKAGGEPQLLLNETREAEGKKYFRLGGFEVSPDGRMLAWAADDDGSERFKLRVRDLATGADIATVATDALGSPVWSNDSKAIFWSQVNEEWRPWRVRMHRVRGPVGDDRIVFEERDTGFRVGPGKTQDRRWITISTGDHVTTEVHLIDAANPEGPMRVVSPRKAGREYSVDSRGDTLFILTNDTHPNFRLATASAANPGEWREMIAGSDRDYLRGVTAFKSYLAISQRRDGLDQQRLVFADGRERFIEFPEASYTASQGTNAEEDAPQLRLSYASMVTPQTVYDYDVAADRLVTRKVQEIPSGYDASRYATERVMARARDGTMVPVSVVYRRDYPKNGTKPLMMYGYGAYGYAVPPGFSANRLSLLDRGFAFAIAHIRGGDDLGRAWYTGGKLKARTNTFNDFVDATKHLNSLGFGRPGLNAANGGSAGGSLMGAVVNSDPKLWSAVVADVPFVDVLNTMLDEKLPLTPPEWNEWGNPITDADAFKLLLSYSPYDQVKAQDYPPIMVTAGLNDPRVTYWEPAKWVARLRATKTGDSLLVLRTNMGAGHGGKSGRFDALREVAEMYAFIISAADQSMKGARLTA